MSKILMPQLISMLAASAGKSKKQSEAFLKAFFAVVSDTLAEHEAVKIKGIGTFKVNRIEARKSVNVSTGADVQIPPHYRVVFTPSKTMAERVNKEFSWLDVVEISDNISNEELDAVASGNEQKQEGQKDTEQTPQEETVVREVQKEIEPAAPVVEEVPAVEEVPVEEEITEEEEVREEIAVPASEEREVPPVKESPEIKKENLSEAQNQSVYTIGAPVVYMQNHSVIPGPASGATWTVAGEHAPTEKEVKESEQLGEKLEEEFGNIEPVEPFGPVDPGDPEPGQPIPEEKAEESPMGDFDPYKDLGPEQPSQKDDEAQEKYYITREELEKLVTKSDIKPLVRNLKKVKASVNDNEEKSIRRSRSSLIWSVVISAALMTGGFFILYYILSQRFVMVPPTEVEKVEEKAEQPKPHKDTKNQEEEYAPASVKGISAAKKNESKQSNIAPTNPSDIKAMDKITSTRYLTTMAKEYYGNYNFWPYIYIENEGKLGHPDRIKPGTAVVIPDIAKYDVDPSNPSDVEKARKLGVDIYKKYARN